MSNRLRSDAKARKGPKPILVWDRFWSKVLVGDGCWMWTAATARDGYGWFSLTHSKLVTAHRLAYELLVGPIPDGLQIDHLCYVKACVNPDHLEPVTPRENSRRYVATQKGRKTHCPQGHPYDEANTYVSSTGSRRCRICHREQTRQYRAALRVEP